MALLRQSLYSSVLWQPEQLQPSQVWFILKQSQQSFRHLVFLQLQVIFFPSVDGPVTWEALLLAYFFYLGSANLGCEGALFSLSLLSSVEFSGFSGSLLSSSDISGMEESSTQFSDSSSSDESLPQASTSLMGSLWATSSMQEALTRLWAGVSMMLNSVLLMWIVWCTWWLPYIGTKGDRSASSQGLGSAS